MTWAEILEGLASARPDTLVAVEVDGDRLAVAEVEVHTDDDGAVTGATLRVE